MKRFFAFVALMGAMLLASCSEFDDSKIWDKLDNHESRISQLEELCKQMNTNISSLQTIVNALQENDYITNVSPVRKDGEVVGYTITFAHSDTITIYHGEDGKNGQNGADGKDGYTPQIGVMKDTDDIYYWTVDGEWLLDGKGNKIKAVGQNGADGKDGTDGTDGEDGKDGTNGTNGSNGTNGADGKDGVDGVTPRLKIEDDYWYISYDEGKSWEQLGKATGADGADGSDANGIKVSQDDEYVYFELVSGEIISIAKKESPCGSDFIDFDDVAVKTICIKNWDANYDGELSYDEATAVTELGTVFKGTSIRLFNELQFFTGLESVAASAFEGCESLVSIILPSNIKYIYDRAFYECTSLRTITIPKRVVKIEFLSFSECTSLKNVFFEENSMLENIGGGNEKQTRLGAFYRCKSLTSIIIPSGVGAIFASTFEGCTNLKKVEFEPNSKCSSIGGYFNEAAVSISDGNASGAFSSCTSLIEITIPASVENIGIAAFFKCTSLQSVVFENESKLKSIEGKYDSYDGYYYFYGAFSRCESLSSIDIPASVEIIGAGAFLETNLTEFTIPASVEKIGLAPFPKLKKLYCKPINPPIVNTRNAMLGNGVDRIYVPRVSVDSYKLVSGWAYYSNYIFGYDFE